MSARHTGRSERFPSRLLPLVAAISSEIIMPSTDILYQLVAGGDNPGRPGMFQAPHRPEPRFEPRVVGFNSIVRILVGDVAGAGQ